MAPKPSVERPLSRYVLASACLVVPLLILAPHCSFSFDSLPKVIYLYLSASLVLFIPGNFARSIAILWHTTAGKLFLLFCAIASCSAIVSALLSTDIELSLFGTRWRYLGSVSQIAVFALGVAAAGSFLRSRDSIFVSLRMLSLAGLFTSLYALSQFFGLDPILDPRLYTLASALHVTRPPSSFGHPGYLAGFECTVFFVALALRQVEQRRGWQLVMMTSAGLALIAILLSGTRAAVLAVVLCCPVFFITRRMRARYGRLPLILLLGSLAAFGALILAPQGEGLRQRVRQSTEDLGGPRLLLWHDALHLIEARLLTGSGPETFSAVFPAYESGTLYRRYPDFQQESPHNIFLDAAAAQGLFGWIALAFGFALAAWCAWKTENANADFAITLAAALAASLIFHQFFAFTLPIFFTSILLIGALVALNCPVVPLSAELPKMPRGAISIVAPVAGIVLVVCAAQLSVTDHAFASVDAFLKHGNIAGAVEQYHQARHWNFFGNSPDLWYSQQMAYAVQALPPGELRQLAQAEALESSRIGYDKPGEDRVTAAYHRAILLASTGQEHDAEQVARRLNAEAPNWYQSHWILSRLLIGNGRFEEGKREADLALALVGDAPIEVRQKITSYHRTLVLLERPQPPVSLVAVPK